LSKSAGDDWNDHFKFLLDNLKVCCIIITDRSTL
jgi:hypothetical protein